LALRLFFSALSGFVLLGFLVFLGLLVVVVAWISIDPN
jgi:hypothetical protein